MENDIQEHIKVLTVSVMIFRAEIEALKTCMAELTDDQDKFVALFRSLYRENLERSLLRAEDDNPAVAAALQAELDGLSSG